MASSFSANSDQFLSSLDAEIERLQQIRTQVADALGRSSIPAKSVGRPRKQPFPVDEPKVRKMSEEGRRRIAEAQKARWAKQKKTAKKQASKPTNPPVVAKKAPAKTASKNAPRKTAAKAVPVKKVAAKKAAVPAPIRKSAPTKKAPAKTAVTTSVAAELSTEA